MVAMVMAVVRMMENTIISKSQVGIFWAFSPILGNVFFFNGEGGYMVSDLKKLKNMCPRRTLVTHLSRHRKKKTIFFSPVFLSQPPRFLSLKLQR